MYVSTRSLDALRGVVFLSGVLLMLAPMVVAHAQEEEEEACDECMSRQDCKTKRCDICTSTSDCGPWAVCSVSLGECKTALSPLQMCSGTCVAGST